MHRVQNQVRVFGELIHDRSAQPFQAYGDGTSPETGMQFRGPCVEGLWRVLQLAFLGLLGYSGSGGAELVASSIKITSLTNAAGWPGSVERPIGESGAGHRLRIRLEPGHPPLEGSHNLWAGRIRSSGKPARTHQ